MSFLSKIPEPLIALLTGAIEPLAAKVWHVFTDKDEPATLKDAAKHAAQELAAKVAELAKSTLDPAYLKTMLERVTEQMGSLDPLFHLAQVVEEQLAVRREMQATIEDLERQVADLTSKLTGGVQ